MVSQAQTRYSGAVRKALDIIAETSDGDRSDKLFRAGVHMGKFAAWQCADPGIAQTLLSHAQASGADHSALGHIERGLTEGRRKPNTEPTEREQAHETETLAQLLDRKRISRGVIAAFGLREWKGAIYYPVPPEFEQVRALVKPPGKSKQWWGGGGLHGKALSIPYGAAQLRGGNGDVLYVVNGASGVWAGWTAEVDAVSALRGEGNGLSPQQVDWLVATGRPLRVVTDLDATGQKGNDKMVKQLRDAGAPDVLGLLLPETLGSGGDFGDLWAACRGDATIFRACLESLPERAAPQKTITQPDLPDQSPAPLDLLTRACPGIPAPAGGVKVPFGYLVSSDGVWKQAKDDEDEPRLICGGPVAVVGYSRDKDTQAMTCTIAYRRPHDPTWYTHECDRATLMEARKVSSLSAVGVPVTSGQAAGLVHYFAASEAALSESGVPVSVTTSVMGWHGNTFVRGYHSHGDAPRLKLPGASGALAKVAESLHVKGTLADWKAVVWPIAERRETLRTMLAAAIVPVIRHIIDCPMFAVDVCGETSVGKTTAMLVAASVWGNPGNAEEPGYMRTWEGTRVAIEMLAGTMRSMPVLLDDTRRQKYQSDCAQIVYDIVAGEGRMRGARDGGMRSVATYSTVLVSTGEGPLKDMIEAGGLTARCLTIWGSPMGGESTENAELSERLVTTVRHHYGHLAELAIEWVRKATRNMLGDLAERYQRYLADFRRMLPPGAPRVALRQAQYAAAVSVAGKLLCWIADLPRKTRWISPEVWGATALASGTADRATAALYDLHTHVYQHADQIYRAPGRGRVPRGTTPEPTTPPRGWLAHLNPDGLLSVPRGEAQSVIERLGYNHNEVVSAWKERGWLRTESGRSTANVSIAGNTLKCYSFTASAMAVTQAGEPREPGSDDDADTAEIPF